MESLYRSYSSQNQVIHEPNQIRDLSELIVGSRYNEMIEEEEGERIRLSVLEITEINLPRFKAKVKHWDSDRFTHEAIFFCADYGIMPNKSGSWNTLCYLTPSDE
jgi:hypothetical protein